MLSLNPQVPLCTPGFPRRITGRHMGNTETRYGAGGDPGSDHKAAVLLRILGESTEFKQKQLKIINSTGPGE